MDCSKDIIQKNLKKIKNQILIAENKAHREPNSVKLLAVSKFHPTQSVLNAIEAKQFLFGENRVQEATQKFEEVEKVTNDFELHIIGSLQRNKVKNAVKIASYIESVDRLELLEEIEKQCAKINKTISVLFEFHTGEESKSGFQSVSLLEEALQFCAEGKAPHICPKGFMTMAPFTDDKNLIRNSFSLMKKVSLEMQKKYPQFDLAELSMGMSNDFELAIEEGSTQVRVGTAIFGERNY